MANPILFNAVVSGVFSGINTSRSLASAVGATYATQVTNANAFATLLDDEIAAGAYSQADADLLGGIVQQIVSGKGSAGLNMVTVNAIIAAFNAARAVLNPAGGGGAGLPIASALFVWEATLVDVASQNGTVGAPYSTAQAAFDALLEDGVLLIAPGGLNGNLVADMPMGIRGLGALGNPPSIFTGDITSDSAIWLTDLLLVGTLTVTGGSIIINGGSAEDIVNNQIVTANNCERIGGSAVTFNLFNIAHVRALAAVDATIRSSTMDAVVHEIFGTLTLTDCNGAGEYTLTADCIIRNCAFTGAEFNVGGDLYIDTVSYINSLRLGTAFNIVGAGAIIFLDDPQSDIVSIVVPAVVAGQVQYVDTSLVGTDLEDLLGQEDAVKVNPTTDLVAAGVGGGFLNERMSADNTLRCTFIGPLAGGAADFTVTRIR